MGWLSGLGRASDQLLAAGLLNQYLASVARIGEFRDELRRRLCQHLASIALNSEIDPFEGAPTFTATVDVAVRTEWMDQISWQLAALPLDAVEYQWQRWMRKHWADRLESIPNQLTYQEASAMASWVVYLGDSMREAVALAIAHSAGLVQHTQLLVDLTSERVAHAPEAVASLITHLLKGTQRPFYECYAVRDVVTALRAQPIPPDVEAITEQAVRLDCGDAPTW